MKQTGWEYGSYYDDEAIGVRKRIEKEHLRNLMKSLMDVLDCPFPIAAALAESRVSYRIALTSTSVDGYVMTIAFRYERNMLGHPCVGIRLEGTGPRTYGVKRNYGYDFKNGGMTKTSLKGLASTISESFCACKAAMNTRVETENNIKEVVVKVHKALRGTGYNVSGEPITERERMLVTKDGKNAVSMTVSPSSKAVFVDVGEVLVRPENLPEFLDCLDRLRALGGK